MLLGEDRIAEFKKIAESVKGNFNILITEVDPDALGSALGLAGCIKKLNPSAKPNIYYCGTIGRAQNIDIFNKYGLDQKMKHISEWTNSESEITMLVDSSRIDDSRLPEKLVTRPTVIVDHHKTEGLIEEDGQFYLIENVGATCTLIIEIIQSIVVEIDFQQEENRALAVLLALGIYTDTESRVNTCQRDRDAYDFITKHVDLEDFNQLLDYDYPDEYYDCLFYALGNRQQEGSRLVAGVGIIEESEGSLLSMIAEHLMKNSSVTIVVVWGVINDQIKISVRSRGLGIRLDDFLKRRFGKEFASGRMTFRGKGAGGGNIPLHLGILKGESAESKKDLEKLVMTRIKELVFSI